MDAATTYLNSLITGVATGILAQQDSASLTDETRALVLSSIRAGVLIQQEMESISLIEEAHDCDFITAKVQLDAIRSMREKARQG